MDKAFISVKLLNYNQFFLIMTINPVYTRNGTLYYAVFSRYGKHNYFRDESKEGLEAQIGQHTENRRRLRSRFKVLEIFEDVNDIGSRKIERAVSDLKQGRKVNLKTLLE